MFESKTAVDLIPKNQLYLYYLILFTIYLFFLRKLRPTWLTLFILLMFSQGFIILFDAQNRLSKILFTTLVFIIGFSIQTIKIDRVQRRIIIFLALFTGAFYFNYLKGGVPFLWATYQYYKFFVPITLFILLKSYHFYEENIKYYTELIFKFAWFQIVFSIVKIIVIGLRENITGSIADTGGGLGIGLSLLVAILYWDYKEENLNGKDWIFILALLIIPGASNKRAIWFIYPILLLTMNIGKITFQQVLYVFFLGIIVIYVGFRLNPSLNPEKKLWGSFDPEYAIDYAMSYSGVSEEKQHAEYAQGRWGASMAVITMFFDEPLNVNHLFGYSRARTGKIDYEDFRSEDYGIMGGSMMSAVGRNLVKHGIIGSILILLLFFTMIYTVKDSKIRSLLILIFLWDYILYSGNFVGSTFETYLLVLTITLLREKGRLESISNGIGSLRTGKRNNVISNNYEAL